MPFVMSEEILTAWVRLKGADRQRAEYMREKEKRSYASLIRIALDHYYYAHYEDAEELIETA